VSKSEKKTKENYILNNLSSIFFGFTGLFLALLSWDLFSIYRNFPTFPRTLDILRNIFLIITNEKFAIDMSYTLFLALSGVGWGFAVGSILGILMEEFKVLEDLLNYLVSTLKSVPAITLFPILIVIFGIGEGARIFIVFWISWPAVLLTTYAGLRELPKEIKEASEIDGANRFYIFVKMKVPLAMGTILNGLKISIGIGWYSIVVAEMLGASKGIGYMITSASNTFQFAKSYAYIIIISLVSALFSLLIDYISKLYNKKLYN